MNDVSDPTRGPAPAGAADAFLEVSECLTGFGRAELLAAGMAGAYEAELRKTYGGDVVSRLLEEVRAAVREAGGDEARLEALLLARVFDDDTVLCAPAKNLAQMWYLGTYIDYTDQTPVVVFKRTTVVSAEAYRQSLVLTDSGSHPAGARWPGYGSWALGPRPAPAPSGKKSSRKERT